jgi:type I restriction enzyme S subunit
MADGHITLARTRPDVLWPRFGYYWLSSRPFQDLISAVLSIGATNQIELSRERLSEAPVPLPPIEEQRRIADFLDTAAQTIERIAMMRRANLRLNAERRRAVLHTELSGDTIRGLKVRHPVLGLLPATWRLAPLKWIVSSMGVGVVVNPSSYFADEGVPFLHGSNVLDGEFALDNVRRMSEADSARLRRSRLNAGDVVVVRAGDPGRAAVVPVELHGANCASIIILRRSPAVESDYLAAYFNSPLGRAYVDVTRYGAAQEQINLSHVADFVVPLPEIQTQKAIVNTINQMEDDFRDLQSKISRQLTLFTEQLNALITAAVTGQIDVTTARGLRCRESGAFGVGV